MSPTRRPAIVFIAIGTAFIGLGLSGRSTFLFIGLTFLILGIAFLRRRRL